MDESLKKEVIKIIIEKILTALIILGVSFLANLFIEKYKAKEAFYTELSKIRVEKLAQVWEAACLLQHDIPNYQILYSEIDREIKNYLINMQKKIAGGYDPRKAEREFYIFEREIEKKYARKIEELKDGHLKNFKYILMKNKFWLDKESYQILNNYTEIVAELARLRPIRNKKNKETIKKLLDKIKKLEQNIDDIREKNFKY